MTTDRQALETIMAELQAADSSTMEHEFRLHLATIANVVTSQLQTTAEDYDVPDEKLNRMAQYLYEGIRISPDLTLVMDMTSKPTLVRVLRAAMIRANILRDRNEWTVATLHLPDCPKCEECADLAVSSARATGSSGGSWQLEESMPDGVHAIMHRAVVERKS